jgi:ferredoxin
MRIHVDMGRCEFHGQCMIAAPEVFDLRGEGDLRYPAEVGDELRPVVEEAMDACPAQAISIEG